MFRRKSKSNQLIGYHNFQIFFSVCAQGYTVLFIQLAWVSAFCFDMHIRFIGIYRRNRSYAVLVFDVQIFFLFCIYEKVIVEHFLSRISYILLIRELCTKYKVYIHICIYKYMYKQETVADKNKQPNIYNSHNNTNMCNLYDKQN